MGTTVNIVCFTSKRLSNGEHPLMLRVCKDRTVKYKSLGISLNSIYWDFDRKMPKMNCPHRELIEKIITDKKHAYLEQILMFKAMNRDFTASTLVEKVENPVRIKTVEESFKSQIESLKDEGRIGNMNVVKDLYASMKKFTKNLQIYYWEIDAVWLRNYEVFLRKKGLADNTIGIRFRTLRAMYNLAIKEKNVYEDAYPFKNFKMAKFQKETVKHAISKDEIKKIMEYQTQNSEIRFAVDMFIFSYLMGGINFVDMSYLTLSNLEDGKLIYTRRKTGKVIILPIHPKAIELVKKYYRDDEPYLFPILSNFFGTDQQKTDRIHRVMGRVNKKLKIIGIELNLPIVLTTYVARHTYASVLKKEGVPISVISESMGHATEKITQTYLERLDYSQLKSAMEKLI